MLRTVSTMAACLEHRGPDAEGYFIGDHVALGHRRLSIIDLATGQQPLFNEDRTVCVIFNGEIYNYQQIKTDLAARGHVFATNSDTETIVHAYEEWGEDCVLKFNGMFAFCIWDSRSETLFIARDRLGEKPLFYAYYKGMFVFSSEMKAILADPQCDRAMDEEALCAYFTFSYIPAPLTIYKSIRKLQPGHVLIFKKGCIAIRQYWDLVFDADRTKKEKDIIHEYRERLDRSVAMRLMSDVPLGAFLSGGIDSSTVVALMSQATRDPVNTFTIGFGGNIGGFEDERPYARLVADRYRTNHHEHEVFPDPDGLLGKIVRAFDEPFADDATIPSYFVSQLARKNVTVALSGLGGDELFCGYERYLGVHLSSLYSLIPGVIREGLIKRFVESLPESPSGSYRINHLKRFVRSSGLDQGKRYFGFVSRMHRQYKDAFFASQARQFDGAWDRVEERFLALFDSPNATDPLNKAFYCDIKAYLPEDILACTDRMSMCHSLEVRVPFLDHELVEYCATIPPEMKIKWFTKKHLLKKGTRGLMPKAVLDHRKQGFVGPMTRWLQTDLKQFSLDALSKKNLEKHGLLNDKTVERILADHHSGREINDTLIWSLLIFQTWFDHYQA